VNEWTFRVKDGRLTAYKNDEKYATVALDANPETAYLVYERLFERTGFEWWGALMDYYKKEATHV